jgi:DNA helicase-2/ATP-dependent DNA helicase PcrA
MDLHPNHSTTWRCNAAIAAFADGIFDAGWDFAPTTSRNEATTGHDGLFAVALEHVEAYVEVFRPLCLRYNAASGRTLDLPFLNIGVAKGLENDRVLLCSRAP